MDPLSASRGLTTPLPLTFVQRRPLITLLVVTLLSLLVTLGVMALIGRQNPGEFFSSQFKKYKTAYLVGALACVALLGLGVKYASRERSTAAPSSPPAPPLPLVRIFYPIKDVSKDASTYWPNLWMKQFAERLIRDIGQKHSVEGEFIACTPTSEPPALKALKPGQKEITLIITYTNTGATPEDTFLPRGCNPASSYLIRTGLSIGGKNILPGCKDTIVDQFANRVFPIMLTEVFEVDRETDRHGANWGEIYSDTIGYLDYLLFPPTGAPTTSFQDFRLEQARKRRDASSTPSL